MNKQDQQNILAYHQYRVRCLGSGKAGALGWSSEKNQRLRFQVLLEIANLNGRSVLDVGCGYGDLCRYLADANLDVDYTGIDQNLAFLQLASKRNCAVSTKRFVLGEFCQSKLRECDYVLASGVLAYKVQTPGYVSQMIRKMYRLCKKGAAFNMLRHVDNANGMLQTFDPVKVKDYCQGIARKVVVLDDYLDNDFTVFMYR